MNTVVADDGSAEYLSTSVAARRLDVTLGELYRYIDERTLDVAKVGRHVKVSAASVEALRRRKED